MESSFRIGRSLIILFLFIVTATGVYAQGLTHIDTLTFCGIHIIPHGMSFGTTTVEGLSGIEYSGIKNQYYAISDAPHKNNSHYYVLSINKTADRFDVVIDSVIFINKDWVTGESIRINPKSGIIYVADEQNLESYIHRIQNNGEIETLFSKTHLHNSGFEGLSFNSSGTKMYISIERPEIENNITKIREYDLINDSYVDYKYFLDDVPQDTERDNGITELLPVNDSTLIVVERAFLRSVGKTSVRVYKARIPGNTKNSDSIEKIKQLTRFNDLPDGIELDNIEGVCFSASGEELIFISDNNKRRTQQTQFICMKIVSVLGK